MEGLTKLAVKVGSKPIAILSLVLSCLAVLAGFLWLGQSTQSELHATTTAKHQQIVNIAQNNIEQQISQLMQQMATLANQPQLALVMARQDDELMAAQQRQLSRTFLHAKKICLIAAHVDKPDPTACMAINFATLNSIRQAKKLGNAPVAVMQLDSEEPYLLLTQRIQDSSERVLGVLLVALDISLVDGLLQPAHGLDGYIELQQGTKNVRKLVGHGNAQWKQGAALYKKPLANSHWHLAYWSATQVAADSSKLLAIVVVALIILLWLLREFWQRLLLKNDVTVLHTQLNDLKQEKLKTKYSLVNKGLQTVADDIQTLSATLTSRSRERRKEERGENRPEGTKSAAQTDDAAAQEIAQEQTGSQGATIDFVDSQQPVEVTPSIFKAYDIRGIVGETLNEQVVKVIGQAIGSQALDQKQTRLIVGRDGRLSSESYANALIEGITASGCGVVDIGQVPTPLVYFACEHLATHSGVMVTGSHNPANYNGLKITLEGKPVYGASLQQLYQRILEGNLHSGLASKNTENVLDDYIAKISSDLELRRKVSVVIDCGNGVSGPVATKLLTALGCEVTELYCDVDGNFPNHHPNPSDPDNLQDLIMAVQHHEAELGLAFDGDGDRLIVVDANGQIIWPDRLMIMFAQEVLSRQAGATIIYDVKCSRLLEDAILRAGGEALMWQSGHSVIKDKMQEVDAQLAGEMSGHIFFKDRWYGFDDALYSACRLLELLARDPLERTPTEVFAAIPNRKNTPEILIDMAEGEGQRFMRQLLSDANFSGAKITKIDGLRADYPTGWGLVRASNTMPGLTLRFEADTAENLQQIQQQFKQQMLQIKPTLSLLF